MENELLCSAETTFGWIPDVSLSKDLNYLDLVLILTRNSQLRNGGMACILTRADAGELHDRSDYLNQIISAANNQELYKANSSDVHAEIVALGLAARFGRATDKCTAYITMPPCKNCFGALMSAGAKKIVSIQKSRTVDFEKFRDGMEMTSLTSEEYRAQRIRVSNIVDSYRKRKEEESENHADLLSAKQDVSPPDLSNLKLGD